MLYHLLGGVVGSILLGAAWGIYKVAASWRGAGNKTESARTMLGSASEEEEEEEDEEVFASENLKPRSSASEVISEVEIQGAAVIMLADGSRDTLP
jgi:hypothetical protein